MLKVKLLNVYTFKDKAVPLLIAQFEYCTGSFTYKALTFFPTVRVESVEDFDNTAILKGLGYILRKKSMIPYVYDKINTLMAAWYVINMEQYDDWKATVADSMEHNINDLSTYEIAKFVHYLKTYPVKLKHNFLEFVDKIF